MGWNSYDCYNASVTEAEFNLGDQPSEVVVQFADLGLSGMCRVRDLWTHQEVAQAQGQFSRVLPAHGAGLYRLARP